jgi:ankyrin repeat protein
MIKLIDAVLTSNVLAMKDAIAAGADLNEFSDGMTPLLWAVFRGDVDAVKILLESGADPNKCANPSESPLWHAEEDFGLHDIAELLRRYGATKLARY